MTDGETGHGRLTPGQRWVLGLCAVGAFLSALDTLVVSTALTTIRVDLGTSLGALEWVVNAYVLAISVFMMAASTLGDRFGRRRVYAVGLLVFAAASALCALAPTVGWLIAGRVLQGTGAAMVMPLALALLGTAFGPERRGWAMGIFSSVIGFSMLSGPLIGGAVVQGISWQWIFWINVPIALAVAVLVRSRLPESYGPAAAVDLGGVVLVTGAAFGIVWGLVRSSSTGWGSPEVAFSLIAGTVFAIAFGAHEMRTRVPLLPMRLFGSRVFSAGNLAMFCLQASLIGSLFFMAQYLQNVLGYDAVQTGVRLMPWGATTFLVPQIAGWLIHRYGARCFGAAGLALYGGCMVWIGAIARPGLPYPQLIAPLVLSGAGFAIAAPAIQTAVLGSVQPHQIGAASGIMSTLRQLGGAFGVSLLAAVFAAAGGYVSPRAFSDGFSVAMVASGALALIGALAGLALPGADSGGSGVRVPSAPLTITISQAPE